MYRRSLVVSVFACALVLLAWLALAQPESSAPMESWTQQSIDTRHPTPRLPDRPVPYLGQPAPGYVPERFPPPELQGTSASFWHGSPAFSADGLEMFWGNMYMDGNAQRLRLLTTRVQGLRWIDPEPPSFVDTQYEQNNPFFSADGDSLYFLSTRPGGTFFRVSRRGQGWSEAEPVAVPALPGTHFGWQFAVARDGTFYFELWQDSGGAPDLYLSRFVDGTYRSPERLPGRVNTEYNEFAPYVDPDQRFLLFLSDRPGGSGMHDIYISYRQSDGGWSRAQNLGEAINTAGEDGFPLVSSDGRYFFFVGVRSNDADFTPYWIPATALGFVDPLVCDGGDYDGDGVADPAVFNSTSRIWDVYQVRRRKYGPRGSVPVPGDYDGDGTTDLAVYVPAKGLWKVAGQLRLRRFGGAGWVAAPADYDGDGATDPAVFSGATGLWLVAESSSSFEEVRELLLGAAGDRPVPGDYDGDGRAEPAVFRPATAQWLMDGEAPLVWGEGIDVPVPADYDGDGRTDIAVWRPQDGRWSVRRQFSQRLGALGSIPVPGDYDGDGIADLAVYDPATGEWEIPGILTANHGETGDTPLVPGM